MQKRLAIILTVTLLTACTNAEMQEYNMNRGMEKAEAARQQCLSNIANDEKYSPIIAHIPITKGYVPTLSELNNTKKPTLKEAQLVTALRDSSIVCEQNSTKGLMQYAPSLAMVFIQKQNETNDNYTKLASRKITWGQFAKANQSIQQKSVFLANQQWQQLQGQLAEQKNRESAQMQQALTQAAEINLRQQEIQVQQNIANQPRMLNCTSSQQGYYVNTSCY